MSRITGSHYDSLIERHGTHRGGIFFFASCSNAIAGADGRTWLKLLVKLLVVFDDRSMSLIRFEFRLLFSMMTFSYPLRTDLNEDVADVVILGGADAVVVVVDVSSLDSFTSITVTKWLGFAGKSLWLLRSTTAPLSLTLSFGSLAAGSAAFGPFSLSAVALTLVRTSSFTVTAFEGVSVYRRPWMFNDNSLMNWLSAPSLVNGASSGSFRRTTTSTSSSSLAGVLVAGVEAARIIWFCVDGEREKRREINKCCASLAPIAYASCDVERSLSIVLWIGDAMW